MAKASAEEIVIPKWVHRAGRSVPERIVILGVATEPAEEGIHVTEERVERIGTGAPSLLIQAESSGSLEVSKHLVENDKRISKSELIVSTIEAGEEWIFIKM